MEIATERLAASEVGAQIAAGRDTTIHAVGGDRVLRRAADDRSMVYEGEAMEAVRLAGFPVPQVHRVGPGEMVLDRVSGPTMLDDLVEHPWRVDSHARLLARLHRELHELVVDVPLRAFPVPGVAVIHLDLHPGNVILSPGGPVVIDWTNVARGPAGADVALTWIVLGAFEAEGALLRLAAAVLRRRLVRVFVDAAGRDEAAAQLRAVAEIRRNDRNTRPAEVVAMDRLVERHAT